MPGKDGKAAWRSLTTTMTRRVQEIVRMATIKEIFPFHALYYCQNRPGRPTVRTQLCQGNFKKIWWRHRWCYTAKHIRLDWRHRQFSMVYFGGTIAYVSGDDPNTKTNRKAYSKWRNGVESLFDSIQLLWSDLLGWRPCRHATSTNSGPMSNAWFYQGGLVWSLLLIWILWHHFPMQRRSETGWLRWRLLRLGSWYYRYLQDHQ